MSKSQLEMVRDFHVATGSPVLPYPGIPPNDRVRLRAKLILEEAFEVIGAMFDFDEKDLKNFITEIGGTLDDMEPKANLAEVGKELNDLLYVTHGAMLEMGLPESMFEAIHMNNMTKIGGPTRSDGKKMKPEGYVAFDAKKWLSQNGLTN